MKNIFVRCAVTLVAFTLGICAWMLWKRPPVQNIEPLPLRVFEETQNSVVSLPVNQAESIQLPIACQNILDKRFPGWRFVEVRDEIRQWLKSVSPAARPELISGDFDGNNQIDYAALIKHGDVIGKDGVNYGQNIDVIVFLKQKRGFETYVLEEGGGEYLILNKKGKRDYDYHTDKEFTYSNDAIFSGIFEKAGTSHVYANGKFKYIVTSD